VRWGLTVRMIIAISLLALIVGAVFALLLVTISDLRDSARRATDTRAELAAADRLEKLVIDLETGARGFVITRHERFLEPWRTARAAFPGRARALVSLVDSPEQAERAQRIASAGRSYIRDFSVPLVQAARRSAYVPSLAETAEGKRRVDALRAMFNRFTAAERELLTARQASEDDDARQAIILGAVGLGGSVVLIVLFAAYLTRAIWRPVRQAAEMAGRLAGGDFAERMPETGVGEIGTLQRAFNAMGNSLEMGRDEITRLLEEQAALRRVATLVAQTRSRSEVFETVTREVGLLSGADLARMERYEPDGTVTGVAGWSRSDDSEPSVGSRFSLEGVSVAALVRQSSQPVRVDSFAGASGPIAQEARALGIRSSVGCPIVVEGRLWGVIAASSKGEEPFPEGTESQISEFTELVATAIANAESRAELIASRARVVAAADDARRRIERDLHDGAQQRLVHAVITLKLALRALREGDEDAEGLVSEALDHSERATSELRELAHGILPSVLARGGLRAGVESCALRISLPVAVEVSRERFSPAIEATAYFVVSEALTNAAKHSGAERAEVRAQAENGLLRIEVRDNGVGGATLDAGTGLLGLRDRVAALDGALWVESPPGYGTVVLATLPLKS
jgi:signal transduction histidine kinase